MDKLDVSGTIEEIQTSMQELLFWIDQRLKLPETGGENGKIGEKENFMIVQSAVSMMAGIKSLYLICEGQNVNLTGDNVKAQINRLMSVKVVFEANVNELLRDVTMLAKSIASEGTSALSKLLIKINELQDLLQDFFRGLENPSSVAPEEYVKLHDKIASLTKMIYQTIDKSVSNPAAVQVQVVPVVVLFKEIISDWWESPLLRSLLEDQKAVFLLHLSRMVKEAQLIQGRDSNINDRISYIRTLAALCEVLNEWLGHRFGMSLSQTIRILDQVKTKYIDKLNLQYASPSTTITPTPENIPVPNNGIIQNSPSNIPPRLQKRLSSSSSFGNQQLNPLFVNPQFSFSSSDPSIQLSPNTYSNSEEEQPANSEPNLANDEMKERKLSNLESQLQPSRPSDDMLNLQATVGNLTKQNQEGSIKVLKPKKVPGMDVTLAVKHSTRTSVKWGHTYYNWKTLNKYGATFFAVATMDFDGNIGNTKIEMLSFQRTDLIAVLDDHGPDSWKGANPRTDKVGYFPRHCVEIIPESFQLFMEMPKKEFEKVKQEEIKKIDQEEQEMETPILLQYGENSKLSTISQWTAGDLKLRGLKLTIASNSKVETDKEKLQKKETNLKKDNLKKIPSKKKVDFGLPVVLNLPDCTISQVTVQGLETGYGGRAIQIIDRLNDVRYLCSISNIEQRSEWVKAISMAALTVPISESIGRSKGKKLLQAEGEKTENRPRSLSLFGNRRPVIERTRGRENEEKRKTYYEGQTDHEVLKVLETLKVSRSLEVGKEKEQEKEQKEEKEKAEEKEKEKEKEKPEKKERRGSLLSKLRPRALTVV